MSLQSFVKGIFYRAGYSVKKIRNRSRTGPGPANQPAGKPSADILGLLHQTNPYEGFDFQSLPLDAHGWGGESPAFRELIAELRPELIVEVGTWKGASALEMASVVRSLNLETRILCIDTWLGALEFWTDQQDPERFQSLKLRNGYPSVYYQFLANVCHRGEQERIIPFPQTSLIAALWLRYYGISAKMIYVDASHEEEDVYQDLGSYWDLVSEGGVLFGDDYGWDGVRLAVERFAKEEGKTVTFLADKWILRKD